MNPANDDLNTKERIFQTAFELFGRYGYEGTSIRRIAKESGVNLAAVNYHFTNKESLFWEIMAATFQDLDRQISEYEKETKTSVDLAMKVYDHFLQNQLALKNAMKMMLSESVPLPSSPELLSVIQNPMGPPGGKWFAKKLQDDIPYPLSSAGIVFGVRSIFGVVMHWGTMMCAGHLTQRKDQWMDQKTLRSDIQRMIQSSIDHIKLNPQLYRAD